MDRPVLEIFGIRLQSEVGLAEVIAALTAAAVVTATIYNLGFFSGFGISYISLLSVQDIILGTTVSIGLIILSLLYAGVVRSATVVFRDKFSLLGEIIVLGTPLGIIASFWIFGSPYKYASIVVLLFGLFAFLTVRRVLVLKITERLGDYLVIMLLAFPFLLGISVERGLTSSYSQVEQTTITYKTGETISGMPIKISSEYVFLYTPPNVQVVALSEVRSVSRKGD